MYHICNPSLPELDFWGELALRHRCTLLVRTWTRSLDLDPYLDSAGVVAVLQLGLPNQKWCDAGQRDHAKLAVSHEESAGLVVVGDLNHTEPQMKRGGGGVVLRDPRLWRALRDGLGWQPEY